MMKMRSMTQEVVIDVSVTMNASPDVPTNGASKGVDGVRSTDADGDVHMERSPASNGHGDNTPRQSSLAAMDSTLSRATSNFDFSHQRSIVWRMTMKLDHLQPSALVNIQTLIRHLLPM